MTRIQKMLENWQQFGWAKSHISENDAEFFKLINQTPFETNTTSFTGNDIVYYQSQKVTPRNGSMIKI